MEIKWNNVILQRTSSKRKQNRNMEHLHVRYIGPDQKVRLQQLLQNSVMRMTFKIFCNHIFLNHFFLASN